MIYIYIYTWFIEDNMHIHLDAELWLVVYWVFRIQNWGIFHIWWDPYVQIRRSRMRFSHEEHGGSFTSYTVCGSLEGIYLSIYDHLFIHLYPPLLSSCCSMDLSLSLLFEKRVFLWHHPRMGCIRNYPDITPYEKPWLTYLPPLVMDINHI